MANTGSYSMCMRGTDEAIEELRALLNSDAFPSIYGCDNFGFDEPNRFSGEFNGSFLNSVDIYDEESLFRSTVAQLGLEVEVYGQEVGSSYEEHFVIEGDSLTVDEQDGNAFDEPIADLTLDEIDEIAKTYGMGASRDAVIKAYDNGNIRFGGYGLPSASSHLAFSTLITSGTKLAVNSSRSGSCTIRPTSSRSSLSTSTILSIRRTSGCIMSSAVG